MEVPTAEIVERPGMPGRNCILCTTADDAGLYAVAHALLSPILDVRGILTSDAAALAPLLALLGPSGQVPVGSGTAFLLDAVRAGAGPFFVLALGTTDEVVAAMEADRELMERRALVVLAGDQPLASDVEQWQVPTGVGAYLSGGRDDVREKLASYGALGTYLAERATEHCLDADAAVGLTVNPTAAIWRRRPTGGGGPDETAQIRVAERIDRVWLLVDLVAKVARFDGSAGAD